MDAVCPTASFFARLGKASVSLDPVNENVYYIQDTKICRTDKHGQINVYRMNV